MITDKIEEWNWEYLAEGNSSIVFACQDVRWVLRLKKWSSDRPQEQSGNDLNRFQALFPDQEKLYTDYILKPIFGDSKYFLDVKVVPISVGFRERLIKNVVSSSGRPDERKSQALIFADFAALMPHLGFYETGTGSYYPKITTGKSSYSVEIKPKWGFIPKFSTQYQTQLSAKSTACRFCMHQHLKLREGKVTSLSLYCPLDLFSSCSCRLTRSLKYLFDEPQNNLRVFYDGQLIYSGLSANCIKKSQSELNLHLKDIHDSRAESVADLNGIVSILSNIMVNDSWQNNWPTAGDVQSCNAESAHLCSTMKNKVIENSQCLPMGSKGVLQRIQNSQQISNRTMDYIYATYLEAIKRSGKEALKELDDFSSSVWKEFSEKLNLDEQGLKTDLAEMTTEELLLEVQKFLVAATFRDCSIMITFKEISSVEEGLHQSVEDLYTECRFAYMIKLIDLDSKSRHKIEHYKKLNDKILNYYTSKVQHFSK